MKIFPQTEFTASELLEISTSLTRPAVQKYLHSLAYEAGKDICTGQMAEGETAESYLRKVEYVKGGIGIINALLSVELAPPS